MAKIDNMTLIKSDSERTTNRSSTQVVIITSVDDDNDKILSYFNPSNVETFVVDLNKTSLMDACRNPKRSLSQSEQETDSDGTKYSTTKKRKADLTCVVCGGHAIGYNFAQITCESCKAFFRRNALHPIEKTRCNATKNTTSEIQCDIRHEVKHKCQRCRLLKCLQQGMRKDYILTPEQKMSKQQRLEANRRLRTESTSYLPPATTATTSHASEIVRSHSEPVDLQHSSLQPVHNPYPPSLLTESDWSCLLHIQHAYFSASQLTPPASSVLSLELAPDKVSAFVNTFDIQNFTAVRLINFVREIREFEELDEQDRIVLVKYNLTILFIIRHSLTFDSARELCYDLDTTDAVSPSDEAFAQHCKSLFILCYGYEFNRTVMSILHVLVNIVNKDPIILQLLMLIAIFCKGLSADDDQEPLLIDAHRVYRAQSKYTDLLFRYLLQQSSFEEVAMKITRVIEQLLKIQKVFRDFHQYIRSKVDIAHINPLMKSLFHLT